MKKLAVLIAVSLAALAPESGRAQPARADSIVFLHVRVTHSAVRLLHFEVVPGSLKRPRNQPASPGEIRMKVTDAKGALLHDGVMSDPTHVIYEYEDESGQLRQQEVVKDSADATVRIPYDAAARAINFQRVMGKAGGRPGGEEKLAELSLIKIDLKASRDNK